MEKTRLEALACEAGLYPNELREFLYAKIDERWKQARAREAVEPTEADAMLPVVRADG